jgi:MoxR-like ATPase
MAAVSKTEVIAATGRKPRVRKDPVAELMKKDGGAVAPKPKMTRDWTDTVALIESGVRRLLLHGIPGTGKTFAGQNFPRMGKVPQVYNIYLGEETGAYQIIGTDAFHDGSMIWRDGPALLAWRTGGRLVINEIDHASGDALDALIWILDDKRTAEKGIVLATGETVYPHSDFHAIATMNGEPEDLGDALAERLSTRVRITAPHPDAIMQLPQNLWKIASDLTNDSTPASQRVSIRQFRSFAELITAGCPSGTAARASFHHRADELLRTITLSDARGDSESEGGEER